jgi:hypothetical protein
MKHLKNIFILAISIVIIAPMIYYFLATFFTSNVIFWVAVIGAVCVAITGFNEDQKIIQK